MPTSGDFQKKVEGYTGEFYQPKTPAGKVAQTAGEFLPAIIGGPEAIATKLGTRVALPALASEAAGQATEGTAAEPYMRAAGAAGKLFGGGGGLGMLHAGALGGFFGGPLGVAVPALGYGVKTYRRDGTVCRCRRSRPQRRAAPTSAFGRAVVTNLSLPALVDQASDSFLTKDWDQLTRLLRRRRPWAPGNSSPNAAPGATRSWGDLEDRKEHAGQ